MHTVALADPTEVMSVRFRSSLDRLIGQDREAVAELVMAEQDRFLDTEPGSTDAREEAEYVEAVPPLALLDGSVRTTEELRATLAAVDARWRFDLLLALDDYVS